MKPRAWRLAGQPQGDADVERGGSLPRLTPEAMLSLAPAEEVDEAAAPPARRKKSGNKMPDGYSTPRVPASREKSRETSGVTVAVVPPEPAEPTGPVKPPEPNEPRPVTTSDTLPESTFGFKRQKSGNSQDSGRSAGRMWRPKTFASPQQKSIYEEPIHHPRFRGGSRSSSKNSNRGGDRGSAAGGSRTCSPSKAYAYSPSKLYSSPAMGYEDQLLKSIRASVSGELEEMLNPRGKFREMLREELTGALHAGLKAQSEQVTFTKSAPRRRSLSLGSSRRRPSVGSADHSMKHVSEGTDGTRGSEEEQDEGAGMKPSESQVVRTWTASRKSLASNESKKQENPQEYFSEIVRSMARNEALKDPSVLQARPSWADWVDSVNDKLESIKEPPRRGLLAQLIQSRAFEAFVLTVIFVNCGFMGYSADLEVNSPGTVDPVVVIGDWVFQIIYTIELVLKLVVHRQYFFCNESWKANWFDTFLVVVGWLGMGGDDDSGGFSGGFLRIVRLAKLGRTMRAVRAMSELKHLRAFLVCLQGSFMSFFWSLVMLVAVLIIFSLFMVQILGTHLMDTGHSLGGDMEAMFGTVFRSTMTLFVASTGGRDWAVAYDVFSETGWAGSVIYLVFIAFTQLALINIITGIFVESAVQTLRPDRETIVTEQIRQEKENAEELEKLCRQADTDGNGKMSRSEFEDHLQKGRVPRLLLLLGLSKHHVMEFFNTMASMNEKNPDEDDVDEDEVEIASFVQACMQLKGAATNFDVQMIHAELRSMWGKQERRMSEVNEQLFTMYRLMDGMEVVDDLHFPLDGHC